MNQKIGVIIPSYNESENIYLLIQKIFAVLSEATIIIVDDSSIDENKKLIDSIRYSKSLKKKNITVISRFKKSGRGSAVVLGLKEMLKNKKIQYFFEMDADLVHDPKDFNKFIKKIESDKAQVIIGSRYLSESKIIKWTLKRLILSKIVNAFINICLGLKLSDYTNGFRLYNRDAVEFLTRIELRESGFIALSEIVYRLKNNNFIINEVPINFNDIAFGKSSADHKEFASALLGLIRIKIFSSQTKDCSVTQTNRSEVFKRQTF